MASELGISEANVRNIVKRKLGRRSYKISKAHFLDDRMNSQRLQKCRVMKRRCAGLRLQRVIFAIERQQNSLIHRQLLERKGLVARLIEKSHFPKSVMVWGGICATGKTPPVFINRNVKINAHVYQNEILRGVVQPWAMEHFGDNHFFLQQDWAPAHGAKTTISLCENLFPEFWGKDVWPSNSLDLNPIYLIFWSFAEQKIMKQMALKDFLKLLYNEQRIKF